MHRIYKEVKKLERSINTSEIDLTNPDASAVAIFTQMYRVDIFSGLLHSLKYKKLKMTQDEKLECYKHIYTILESIINDYVANLDSSKLSILITADLNEISSFLQTSPLYNSNERPEKNLKEILLYSLKRNLQDVKLMKKILEKHPSVIQNLSVNGIDRNFRIRFEKDVIIYEDAHIQTCAHHQLGIFYNDNTLNTTKNTLISILAFLHCRPTFMYTDNPSYNEKLESLYEQFDMLDMLSLRNKRFFIHGETPYYTIEPTYFKSQNDFVVLPTCSHPLILDLYHSSLKQLEPLPRCVFLYRILEYAFGSHYQPTINPPSFEHSVAIEYYLNKALDHRFIPIYYVDHGMSGNILKGTFRKTRTPSLVNFISLLKKEVYKVLDDWQGDSFLSNYSPGEIIYNLGRNKVAHGGNGIRNSTYDYARNYKHINNVNIILELISRYLIEILNPNLGKVVEKRKSYYFKTSYNKQVLLNEEPEIYSVEP